MNKEEKNNQKEDNKTEEPQKTKEEVAKEKNNPYNIPDDF